MAMVLIQGAAGLKDQQENFIPTGGPKKELLSGPEDIKVTSNWTEGPKETVYRTGEPNRNFQIRFKDLKVNSIRNGVPKRNINL